MHHDNKGALPLCADTRQMLTLVIVETVERLSGQRKWTTADWKTLPSLELCCNMKKWGQNCVKRTFNYTRQPTATAVVDATVWLCIFWAHFKPFGVR